MISERICIMLQRYLHIPNSSQYYPSCMKMETYSLNLNSEGQQEAEKCRQYLWDRGLVHSMFMSCLKKNKTKQKLEKIQKAAPKPWLHGQYEKFSWYLVYKKEDWQVTGLYSIITFPWRKQTLGTLKILLPGREREIPQELMAGNRSQTNSF